MTISEAYKNLINKEALEVIINNSNLCKWATNELKLAGYIPNQKDNPNSWMYEQVMEALAVFTSHGNSGMSAPWEINLVQKLCKFEPITPLTLNDDEFRFTYKDDKGRLKYQNKRQSSIFKSINKDGTIIMYDIDAFVIRIVARRHWNENEFHDINNIGTWSGGTWIVDCNFNFTGKWLSWCKIKQIDIDTHKYTPKKTIILKCYEIGIDDGINGFTNFVFDDSPEIITLCKEYQLITDYVESIVGKNALNITPNELRIAEEELKNKRN